MTTKRVDTRITFIPLTTRCNNNCISCPAPIKKIEKDQSLANIKKKIDSILDYSSHISFNGGEPTLRKDLLRILKYTENKNPKEIKLLTNSKIFYYENYVKKIEKIKNLKIITTLYGHNSKLHDSITRTPRSFNHQVNGIKNLIKYNVPVELRILLHKINYKYFNEIMKFIEENFKPKNLEKIVILNAKLTETAKDHSEIVAEKLTNITNVLEKPILRLIKKKYKINLYCFPHCILPKTLWKYAKKNVINRTEENMENVCMKCAKKDDCSKIWKSYSNLFGSNELRTITQNKNSFVDFKNVHAAYIHVSNICNFRCSTCNLPQKKKKSFVSLKAIEQKIKKAKYLRLNNIIFTGQEVILHPDIDKIIKFSFEEGNANYVTFNTNGLGFSNNNIWNKLTSIDKKYLDKTYIAISVNFFDAKTFSEWSGHKKEIFLKWCNGFKKATDTFQKVLIDVIMKKDSDIIKILNCLSKISKGKSEKIKLRILNLMPYDSSSNEKYSKLKYNLLEINKKINEIVSRHKGKIEFEDFPACIFNQGELKKEKYHIYNFHMIFEKELPLQYEIGVFNTYFNGPTENWEIDKEKLILAQRKMFCYLDECKECYYKKKGSCYGIQREYLKYNNIKKINNEIHILKQKNWIK